MKIGFAITAYDKFEEAKILFEIIRKEFNNYYPISFCSNHKNAEKWAKKEKPEIFTQGVDYEIPGGELTLPSPRRTSMVLRSTDTVQKSCKGALQLDVDYIIHMHADAWVLSEEKIIKLVTELKNRNQYFAVRGLGFSWMGTDTPLGHIDDHFFVFNKNFVVEKKFFDFSVEEFWPHKLSIHGILTINLISKIGLSNIWYYKLVNNLEWWDGRKINCTINYAKPCNYDPEYEMLHVHRGSFPEDYGQKVQAMFLKQCSFNKSEYIQHYIKKYNVSKNILISELKEYEDLLNKLLRKRFFYVNDRKCNRDFKEKEKILNEKSMVKLIYRLIKFLYHKIIKGNRQAFLLNPVIYPERITDYYKNHIILHLKKRSVMNWINKLEN